MQSGHIAATFVLLAACSREPKATATDPVDVGAAERARGAAIIGELKRSLVGALTKAMADGPPAAIEVCHTQAPALAAALARDGVTVGRATRKPRNPNNAVAGWQAEALTQFEQSRAAGTALDGASFARRLSDGRIAYAEPLVIQPVCLACHGTTLSTEVQQTLAARYPEDRATGYVAGDLRGVAWVELPAPVPAPR
jgi:hypothetical protein